MNIHGNREKRKYTKKNTAFWASRGKKAIRAKKATININIHIDTLILGAL